MDDANTSRTPAGRRGAGRAICRAALLAPILATGAAPAGEVEIVHVRFAASGGDWRASVTLRHGDTGWEHYADAWRVVSASGEVLGTRTLLHPHVDEQPFTRDLGGIPIPAGAESVFVEAHDKVHGWSSDRLRIDLARPAGPRYEVAR